jgi:hypothetical protein
MNAPTNISRIIEAVTRGYVSAMLWTTTDEQDGRYLDERYNIDDLSVDARETVELDCTRFVLENWDVLKGAVPVAATERTDKWSQVGHDFWLTRCGHGAGFWDGHWSSPHGWQLTGASRKAGECWVYVSDDNEVEVTK